MNAILQFLNTWEYLIKTVTVVAIFICSIILIVKNVKWLIEMVFTTWNAVSEQNLAKLQLQNFQNMKNANGLNPHTPKDFNKHLDSLGKNFAESVEILDDIIGRSKQIIRKICIELVIFSITAFSCGAGLISFFLARN